MTAWWGLAGLAGLPGIYGLLRARVSSSGRDPLARYPVAREPAVPNADAAHTPLILPRITPDMLHHDGGQVAEPNAVPQARTGDHDSPVPASVSGPQYAPAALRPQAPPSAGRLARPGVPKKPAPAAAEESQSTEQEPDAALVPTQPFPANDDSGTFTGDVAQAAPESPEEPQPAPAASASAGQEKEPIRRPREAARHVAASAESSEEPQPVSAVGASGGQEKEPVRRLRGTARHAAASAESPEEPRLASGAGASAGQEKKPVWRLRETARRVAASAARTVQDRRGQFTRIFRKGNSR